jgi:recombinational DNA repair protein (RecF pathway)
MPSQPTAKGAAKGCALCHKELSPEASYLHKGLRLCGKCCMEARSPNKRKTHWQYLGGSMKSGYLRRPGE